ncbi:hypothetical protein AB0F46_29435 [Streptomyces sp. NPDC026665]|uniref:hypothetical protein n=1 Tax=Streptomyces sp. NPDC026665 TaxID=3154798 RepID=UPI0033E3AEA3
MNERPGALDRLLGYVADNLPDETEATARAREAIAPLEKAIRAQAAKQRAKIRSDARAEAATQLREDAALRDAEGEIKLAAYGRELADLIGTLPPSEDRPGIVRLADQADEVTPNPPVDIRGNADIDRIPIARSVRYAVLGAPEVRDQYTRDLTIAPTEITLTYRASPDSQLGRIHAYVKGRWMKGSALVPMDKPVGRHFHGDLADWPEWLATEARLHDPEQPS